MPEDINKLIDYNNKYDKPEEVIRDVPETMPLDLRIRAWEDLANRYAARARDQEKFPGQRELLLSFASEARGNLEDLKEEKASQ